ncbi:hypothetical protein ME782_02630 [Lactobacillus delbrueckii]|nr:hypothetical protein ME782_02630 [Lactobacillus delbrueckii]
MISWVQPSIIGEKVELLIFKMEFSHVGKPMSVGNNCVEIALD